MLNPGRQGNNRLDYDMPATPLLDREQQTPKPKQGSLWMGFALGAVLGVALIIWGETGHADLDLGPEFLLGFCLAFLIGVLLHELGHLAAGVAVGFEFRSILAGPLMVTKEAAGYRFRFLPRRLLGGGLTAMVPNSADDLPRRFAIFGAGGPIVTALLFVPVLVLPSSLATTCLLVGNLVIAIFSWIPMEVRGHLTDAKLLLLCARKGAAAERVAAILYLIALDTNGVLPSQWPAPVVAKLEAGPKARTLRSHGLYFLYIRARDGGSETEIAEALEGMLARSAEMRADLRRAAFAECAFYQGASRGNAEKARAWLEDARRVKGVVRRPDWDASALAAIAIAEGKEKEAQEQLKRAVTFYDGYPGKSGSVVAARGRLLALLEQRAAERGR